MTYYSRFYVMEIKDEISRVWFVDAYGTRRSITIFSTHTHKQNKAQFT